jgi:hypothetical protein
MAHRLRDRPVSQERQEPVGDLLIISENVLLGDAEFGKEDAIRVGEFDLGRGGREPPGSGRTRRLLGAGLVVLAFGGELYREGAGVQEVFAAA